jgi:hypothetical protein
MKHPLLYIKQLVKKMSPKKRIQHFIPQFILRKFLNDKSFKIINKKFNKSSNKGASNSMYKEYFYEHNDFSPNEIEDLLASREGFYASVIEKLINKTPLTLEEHKILLEFRHTTYYRSNEFIGFHNYKKRRGENDWMERWDWKSLNGIYNSKDFEKDIKKSQLRSIKSVIDRKDPVYYISSLTPICFLFTSENKKFMVSDSGSLCWGDEFDGMVIIVLSPIHAIMFPRIKNALSLMEKLGVNNEKSNVIYEKADDDLVDLVNDKVLKSSFEYYIDSNL